MRENVSVVLVHGAWADGSSWAKVIGPLAAEGVRVLAAPLPLTSFAEDTAAVDRTLERASGLVVLAGHAYAGAVIGAKLPGEGGGTNLSQTSPSNLLFSLFRQTAATSPLSGPEIPRPQAPHLWQFS